MSKSQPLRGRRYKLCSVHQLQLEDSVRGSTQGSPLATWVTKIGTKLVTKLGKPEPTFPKLPQLQSCEKPRSFPLVPWGMLWLEESDSIDEGYRGAASTELARSILSTSEKGRGSKGAEQPDPARAREYVSNKPCPLCQWRGKTATTSPGR